MWSNFGKVFEWDGKLPPFQRMRVDFPRPRVEYIHHAVQQTIDSLSPMPLSLQGKRVAITAGSRGISQIPEILAALVDWLRQRGAQPFIIPMSRLVRFE